MKAGRVFFVILGIFILAGCVSSSKYKVSLEENENLRQNIMMLEEKLAKAEEERSALEAKTKTLETQNVALEAEVATLTGRVEEISLEKEKAVAELTTTYDDLVSELNEEIQDGKIAITQLKDKLSLTMVEKILFASGSAKIKKDGKEILERVGEILEKVHDKQIRIEGHTDNVPIGAGIKKRYPTNWELSAARATNVVRYLQENSEVDPTLLTAAGYGEFRPVASNDTEEGRAKNRRIEIVLLPLDK